MSKKKSKFPKIVYVRFESDGDGGEFFLATKDYSEFANVGEENRVAMYQYAGEKVVVAKAELLKP